MAQPSTDRPHTVSGFADRLASVIGTDSVRAFARRAGLSESLLRQCLRGRTEPTRGKLLAIAEAGGVAVEWLVSGRGPRRPGPRVADTSEPPLDRQWLEMVIDATEDTLGRCPSPPSPAKKARLIAALYENEACRALEPAALQRRIRQLA